MARRFFTLFVNFGNGGGVVEIDETFIGTKQKKAKGARGYAHKNAMLSLFDRTTGRAKSIIVDDVTKATMLSPNITSPMNKN